MIYSLCFKFITDNYTQDKCHKEQATLHTLHSFHDGMIKSPLHEKYGLNALNISQDSRFGNFLFPILASVEIKNSEMCPWLLRGEGDPEHTCNKAKANLITMSFIQRWGGDNGCPLNINGGTQNQKAMIEGQRKEARSDCTGIQYSEQWRTDKMNLNLGVSKGNKSSSYNICISVKELVDV